MGAALEIGHKRGRLTLIRRLETRDKFNFVEYEFLCECGNKAIASARHLASKRSCGCLLRESRYNIGRRNSKDITGMRSGYLVAVRISEKQYRGRRLWVAKCDCGTSRLCRAEQITRKSLVSCGCLHGRRGIALRAKKIRKNHQVYLSQRRKRDVKFLINSRIGNAIRDSLKRGRKGFRHWEDLVGYSIDQLQSRLLLTMPSGYGWSDFLSGALHIDHIIPLCSFSFGDPKDIQFKKAWSLENLRLLTAADNMKKHTAGRIQ